MIVIKVMSFFVAFLLIQQVSGNFSTIGYSGSSLPGDNFTTFWPTTATTFLNDVTNTSNARDDVTTFVPYTEVTTRDSVRTTTRNPTTTSNPDPHNTTQFCDAYYDEYCAECCYWDATHYCYYCYCFCSTTSASPNTGFPPITDEGSGDPPTTTPSIVCPTECEGCVLNDPCQLLPNSTFCRCSCIAGYYSVGDSCRPVTCYEEMLIYGNTMVIVNVTFPTTQAGYSSVTIEKCPQNTPNAGIPYGTRSCNVTGNWNQPVWLSSCSTTIDSLTNVTITTEEQRQEVADDLEVLTSQPDQLDADAVTSTVDVLEEVVNAPTLTTETSASVIGTIGNLLDVPDEQLEESGESERLLQTLDSVGERVVVPPGGSFQEVDPSVAVAVIQPTSEDIQLGVGFEVLSLNVPDQIGFRSDQLQTFVQSPDSDVMSFIVVPGEAVNQSPDKRVTFYAFPDDRLFQDSNNPLVSSMVVLSGTVVGANVSELNENVTIQFELNDTYVSSPPANMKLICSFWNETSNKWSQTGELPTIDNVTNATCSYDHLTNFAVLYAMNEIPPGMNKILVIITLVGCSLSLCGAILTILVYVFVKRTRTGAKLRAAFLLINYAIALVLLNTSIILSEVYEIYTNEIGCLVIGVIIHFSMLSVFGWMTSEAVNIYLTIIHPFFSRAYVTNSRVFLCSILLGWGFPLIFVGALVGVSRDYYTRDDLQCWLHHNHILYFVTIPTGILLALNFVIYCVIIVRVLCVKRPQTSNDSRTKYRQKVRKNFMFSFTLFLTLGGTWVFGFGVVTVNEDVGIIFAYLFTVFNSLQGLMLFLLFVVRHKSTRQQIVETFFDVSSKKSTTSNITLPSWRKMTYELKPQTTDSFKKIKLDKYTEKSTNNDVIEQSSDETTNEI